MEYLRRLIATVVVAVVSSVLTAMATLAAPPQNDNFANPQPIGGEAGEVDVSFVDATIEPDEPQHDINFSVRSVWYAWVAPRGGRLTLGALSIDPYAQTIIVAIYTGETLSMLSAEATDHREGAFYVAAGMTYRIALAAPLSRTAKLSWSFLPPPMNDDFDNAVRISDPEGRVRGYNYGATREPGERVIPGDQGHGAGLTVWYRWTAPASGRFTFTTDGTDAAAEIDTVIGVYRGDTVDHLEDVASGDDVSFDPSFFKFSVVTFEATQGLEYRIAVDGWTGHPVPMEISDGYFYLNWAPTALNDDFALAESLGLANEGAVRGNTLGATVDPREPNASAGACICGRSIWYAWVAPGSGRWTFDTVGSDFNTVLGIYVGQALENLSEQAWSGDVGDAPPHMNPGNILLFASSVSFEATQGQTYYVQVSGSGRSGNGGALYDPQVGAFNAGRLMLHWAPTPSNDDYGAGESLGEPLFGQVERTTRGATWDWQSTVSGRTGRMYVPEVWFLWRAPSDATVTFDTLGSALDTQLGVYVPNQFGQPVEVAFNDDADEKAGLLTSRATFAATIGVMYYIGVGSPFDHPGTFTLNWTAAAHTPTPSVTLTPSPTPTPTEMPTPVVCVGDCDGSVSVTVDELVRGVNIALGSADIHDCVAFDIDHDNQVTVDELVAAVNRALNGCG